ncbi:MAG: hypothetical protein JO272_13210 [Pseudonocardiales bacterium]|nr:hypothetical protein [Pseudonocardiales bacterium]
MQILRNLLVVAAAVAPLAFAIPAEARDELTNDEPTYTCDTVKAPAPGRGAFGEGNCVTTNGAPTSGLIITERPFSITARTGETFHCRGEYAHNPAGNADTPTSVTGNDCY